MFWSCVLSKVCTFVLFVLYAQAQTVPLIWNHACSTGPIGQVTVRLTGPNLSRTGPGPTLLLGPAINLKHNKSACLCSTFQRGLFCDPVTLMQALQRGCLWGMELRQVYWTRQQTRSKLFFSFRVKGWSVKYPKEPQKQKPDNLIQRDKERVEYGSEKQNYVCKKIMFP